MRKEFAASVSLRPWWLRILTITGLGLVACLNATVAPQQPGIITSLWYVNALTIVTLLYHQPCFRALLLAGYMVSLSAGYWLNHVSGTAHLTLMLANLAEVLLAVYLLERSRSARCFYFNIDAALKLGISASCCRRLPGLCWRQADLR